MSAAPKESLITQIFVGDLPRNISQDWLVSLFSQYGEIIEPPTIREYVNSSTAFITFATHEQAAVAIRDCNYTKINGHPIHIQWRDSSRTHDPNANLVITNLPTDIEESELHDALQSYGAIQSCCIRRNRMGESTGVGFVQFESADDAKNALESLKGASIKGQLITIELFKPMDKRQDVLTRLPPNVIAVDGPEMNDQKLRQLFGQYGEISNTFVIDGLGIVMFDNQGSAARANAEFIGDKVTVATQVRKEIQQAVLRRIEERRVYISEVTHHDEEGLKGLMETAGKVVSLELHSRPNGEMVGIVQFQTAEARETAVQTLNGQCFGTQVTPIKVLPFYDKRLEHPPAGLLQLNEVKASVTASKLRTDMAAFGKVTMASVVATGHTMCIGYVLFENYETAKRAHAETVNSFLFPMLDANDVVGAFCDNLRARCVAVYNLPAEETTDSVQALFTSFGHIEGLIISSEQDRKTAFAYYISAEGVVEAMRGLRAGGYEVDLLGSYIMMRAGRLMTGSGQRKEMRQGMLFVSGLGPLIDSKRFREIFESIGPVESAMVQYNANNGVSMEKGILLFKDPADAVEALQSPPISSDLTPALQIMEYRARDDKFSGQSQIPKQPQQQPAMPQQQPQQYRRMQPGQSPRELLRTYIRANVPPEHQQKLLDAVSVLCLADVHEYSTNHALFVGWMEQLMK